jgi:hypothetical protein
MTLDAQDLALLREVANGRTKWGFEKGSDGAAFDRVVERLLDLGARGYLTRVVTQRYTQHPPPPKYYAAAVIGGLTAEGRAALDLPEDD